MALPADGTAATMTATFESGNLTQPHAVAWTAANALSDDVPTIRSGDALRLTAFPGTTPDAGTVTITGPGVSINTTADAPVIHTFEHANLALAANGAVASQSSTYPGG
ncbi:MAG: hypothetical protein V4733_00005 [Verrucomicrobiota bacterium]